MTTWKLDTVELEIITLFTNTKTDIVNLDSWFTKYIDGWNVKSIQEKDNYKNAFTRLTDKGYIIQVKEGNIEFFRLGRPLTLDDTKPHPIFNQTCVSEIHPAQDFTENLGFTSLFLNYDFGMGQERVATLVTSDRRLFYLTADHENILEQHGFRKKYQPINLPNRWSEPAVEHFLNTPNNNTELSFVYEKLHEQLKYYFDWSHEIQYDFVAVWIIGTYFHQLFSSYPYVQLLGSRASGKTKLMALCGMTAFNGYHVTGITPATLFRIVQNSRCSLLIDEAEYDKHEIKELQGLLTGYTKGTLVPRMTETKRAGVKGHEIEFFEVYSPKMLGGIHGIEDILEDRCITIITEKPNLHTKEGKLKANRFPDATDKKWQDIRDLAYAVMLEHFKEIRSSMKTITSEVERRFDIIDVKQKTQDLQTDSENLDIGLESVGLPNDVDNVVTSKDESVISKTFDLIAEHIDARNLQLWLPIYAVAYTINWELFSSLVDYSVEIINTKKDVSYLEDRDTTIFTNLIKNITSKGLYTITSLTSLLKADVGEQYWLNERYMGKALRRLDVVLGTSRGSKRSVLLDPDVIRSKAERFGIDVEDVVKVTNKEKNELIQSTLGDSLDVHKDEAELEGEEFTSD